ncbi:hypothetical protein KIN20_004165 [Parelaphostrongylus tenuis]|uniref:Uncharacterized protein n=1 Tax=Parelaphostrongylus tenuis TaxID=148309 RepID=A0AAD5M1B0_PARTN|nr:hypothetical protein KIN20_004165 [Parelaphostrongylus tenuis]
MLETIEPENLLTSLISPYIAVQRGSLYFIQFIPLQTTSMRPSTKDAVAYHYVSDLIRHLLPEVPFLTSHKSEFPSSWSSHAAPYMGEDCARLRSKDRLVRERTIAEMMSVGARVMAA